MSNISTLLAWANGLDEAGAGAALELLNIPPQPAGHDEPDEHGFVALTGLPPDSDYADKRFAIKEIADSLPAGPAKDCANANIAVAHLYWIIDEFIPVCRELDSGNALLNGPNIPNTFACSPTSRTGPFLATVMDATKYFAERPKAVTTGDGAGFGPHN
jgi:hypothetical protein